MLKGKTLLFIIHPKIIWMDEMRIKPFLHRIDHLLHAHNSLSQAAYTPVTSNFNINKILKLLIYIRALFPVRNRPISGISIANKYGLIYLLF